jgi:hypothetical protein
MDSTTELITVYVRLLNEGTDVSRPTKAVGIGRELYKLLATPDYSPEDETWEFPPGTVVRCEERIGSVGPHLLAVKA